MLNLKELFKKRPFIYYIDGEYYALGAGVCSCCCSKGTYLTLPKKYEDYLKIKNRSVDSDEAWEVYRKLSSIADMIKSREENVNPEQKFKELGFNEKNCDELENQLQEMVEFFERNYLLNYCKQEGI